MPRVPWACLAGGYKANLIFAALGVYHYQHSAQEILSHGHQTLLSFTIYVLYSERAVIEEHPDSICKIYPVFTEIGPPLSVVPSEPRYILMHNSTQT